MLHLIYFSDRMAKVIKIEVDVKDSQIISTETCFVDIPEDEVKLENTGIKGNFDKCTFS